MWRARQKALAFFAVQTPRDGQNFCGNDENIQTTMYMKKASMIMMGKILENITLWREGEKKEVKIGRGDQNKIGWENFLHGRIAMEMRKILPRAGSEANNHPEKSKRLVRAMA
jgi:hypothetical protein